MNALFQSLRRFVSGFLVISSSLLALTAHALPPVPVYLRETYAPNVALTVDDSGSMAWSYFPDALGRNGLPATNRFLAAEFNPLAYDRCVNYPVPPNADGTFPTNSFNAALVFGHIDNTTVNLSFGYSPTVELWVNRVGIGTANYTLANRTQFYFDTAPILPALRPVEPAFYYRIPNAATNTATCTTPTNGPDSDATYVKTPVTSTSGRAGSDERQNFATWYAFYRTRNLMTKSGLMMALYGLDANVRVTFQDLQNNCSFRTAGASSCASSADTPVTFDNQIKPFSAAHRATTFNWIKSVGTVGGTPLRDAFIRTHDYFSQTGANNPWGTLPGTTEDPKQVCRLSYHIALTDGAWNGALPALPASLPAIGNADSTVSGSRRPYADTTSNTLADIAFKSWSTDLQSGMANTSPPYADDSLYTLTNPAPIGQPGTAVGLLGSWSAADYWEPRNDPATWQHLVTYTIGLGLSKGLINPKWAGSTFATDSAGDGYAKILSGASPWPAADDGSDNNVYDLWHAAINGRGQFYSADNPTAILNAFNEILARISGRVGSAGAVSTSSGYAVGNSLVFQSSFSTAGWTGSVLAKQIDDKGNLGAEVWNTDATLSIANSTVSVAASRVIYSRNSASTAPILFNWSALNGTSRTALNNDQDLVKYLRGDRSREMGSTTCNPSPCVYRTRNKLLGDIFAGAPVVSANQDYGYKSASWATVAQRKSYATYLDTKKTRTAVVVVGANDGILHVLNAGTGGELFGYIPSVVIPNLKRLAQPIYIKTAFVDGPITVGDALTSAGWKTYAVSALGPGGKAVVALDITDATSPTTAAAKWEFTDVDLGYVISKPSIQRLPDGKWAAIFSGGYESGTPAEATLFIVNLETGVLISKLKTVSSNDACGVSRGTRANGLGAPRAFDTKDGKFYVYAGDLLGNLWRFERVGTSGSTYAISFTGKPLFKACAAGAVQPITAAPTVDSFGILPYVYFGTGRLFDTGDGALTNTQSFYALIDDNVTPTDYVRTNRLVQQNISVTTSRARLVSGNLPNLAASRGWFVDLPADRERIVAPPSILEGRVVFATIKPTDSPTSCEPGGDSWLFNLDAQYGTAAVNSSPILDVNGDGVVNASDLVSTGVGSGTAAAAAIKLDGATIGGVSAIRTVVAPKPGTGSGAGTNKCKPGDIKLLTSNLYSSGISENCTPGTFMRSGWRQIR